MTSFSQKRPPRWVQYEDDHAAFYDVFVHPDDVDYEEYYDEQDAYYDEELLDRDLIPHTNIQSRFYLPVVFASLVSVISVLGMWFAVRYLKVSDPQPQMVAHSHGLEPHGHGIGPTHDHSVPLISTTISQGLRENGGTSGDVIGQSAAVIPEPTLIPTASPSPAPQITPIPRPAYGFRPNGVEQTFVTDQMATDMQAILFTEIPFRDYLDVHLELTHLTDPGLKLQPNWQVGDVRTVNVMGDPVTLRLAALGDRAYIWTDERLRYTTDSYETVSKRLDSELYPKVTSLFGPERSPGIDGDPRFHIFHLATLESRELGFFDSSDVYPTEIFADSNENEAIYINMESLTLGGEVYYGTLVHELQHLIRWSVDRNEETWLDEGLSQVTEIYAGFNSFTVDDYVRHNDIQLNSWSYESADIYSHYGGAALFVVYLWEQFGDQFIRDLAASPEDGMAAVSQALRQSGTSHTLQSVFSDWLVAVYKNNPNQAEYRYGFSQYEFNPPAPHQIALSNTGQPFSDLRRERPQFSPWYVDLPSNQTVTVSFAGDSTQSLFPHQNQYSPDFEGMVFYVPPRDRMNASLSRLVDLRNVLNPAVAFDVWYDLENGYDHLYLMVSADGGNSWTPVQTSAMTQGTYGPGLTGQSGGWVTQTASLIQFSGREVIIKFQVLTDSAVPGRGLALDNINITGVGNASFDASADGWNPAGFVRTGSKIPQPWTVSVVHTAANGELVIERLEVDQFGELKETLNIGSDGTLIIAPSSPLTQSKADFWFSVE